MTRLLSLVFSLMSLAPLIQCADAPSVTSATSKASATTTAPVSASKSAAGEPIAPVTPEGQAALKAAAGEVDVEEINMNEARKFAKDIVEQPAVASAEEKFGAWRKIDAGPANENLKLVQIAVGDINNVWATGDDKRIYRLTDQGWVPEATGVYVAAAGDGTVVAINEGNELFKRIGEGQWELIPDIKLSQVSVGNANMMWGVFKKGDKSEAYEFDDGKWEKVKNVKGEDAAGFIQFSVDQDGIALALDDKNNMYRRDIERVGAAERTEGARKKRKKPGKKKRRMKKKKAGKKEGKRADKKAGKKEGKKADKKEGKKADKKEKGAKKLAKKAEKEAKKQAKKEVEVAPEAEASEK